MKQHPILVIALVSILVAIAAGASPAHATQTHSEPEGLVVHQIAHFFFALSMGLLVYWLRARQLTFKSGWRFIQYAAILLILWNVDAFAVHVLDEFTGVLSIQKIGHWHIRIDAQGGYAALAPFYYLAKLDHVWCVPALVLLFLGLRRLTREENLSPSKNERP